MTHSRGIFLLTLLLVAASLKSQSIDFKRNIVQKVYDDLVEAYGNAKSAPDLKFIVDAEAEGIPASYLSEPIPTIKLEEKVYDICAQMGKDSLDALALILSHELAHYYSDHAWWSDYSYANRNAPTSIHQPVPSKEDQIKYETHADYFAFFYCCIAGYSPYDIYDALIDAIYETYKLPNTIPGYLSKQDRKWTNHQAWEKIKQLYPVYDAGIVLLYLGQFTAAEACYDYLAKYFPSREVYNNLGVAKFLNGLSQRPYEKLNFLYPVEIDPVSRIYQNGPRGIEVNKDYISILLAAKRDFEKAISLDPEYYNSYLNLACVNDALGNYQAALGNIFETERLHFRDTIKLKLIEGIIRFHLGDKEMAGSLLKSIIKQNSLAAFNYGLLNLTLSTNDIVALENYKNEFADSLKTTRSLEKLCDSIPETKISKTLLPVQISNDLSITSMIFGDNLFLKIADSGKEILATVHNIPKVNLEQDESSTLYLNPNLGCLLLNGQSAKTIKYLVK